MLCAVIASANYNRAKNTSVCLEIFALRSFGKFALARVRRASLCTSVVTREMSIMRRVPEKRGNSRSFSTQRQTDKVLKKRPNCELIARAYTIRGERREIEAPLARVFNSHLSPEIACCSNYASPGKFVLLPYYSLIREPEVFTGMKFHRGTGD